MAGPSEPTQTTSTTGPSNPNVTPVLNGILGGLKTELDKPVQTFNKSTYAGPSKTTTTALDALIGNSMNTGIQRMARAGFANAEDLINGTGLQNGQDGDLASIRGIAGQFNTPGAVERNLMGVANGDYLNGGNPYFEANLARTLNDATSGFNAGLGASGRLGSNLHTQALSEGLGTISNQARGQQYETERDRQVQAASLVDAAGLSRLQGGQNAYGQAFGMGQQGTANQFAANEALPGLFESFVMPAKTKLQAGLIKDGIRQGTLQGEYDLFNRQQNANTDMLAKLSAILSGTAGTGGTYQTTPGPSLAQTLLGGAIGLGGTFL